MSLQRVTGFIERLTHTAGPAAGSPFQLRDWQRDTVLKPIYDPVDEHGLRKVRTAFISMPRKQGKTELAAALSLYHLAADGEQAAQVYSAAADRAQAALIFNAAATMIRNDPELAEIFGVVDSQKRIVHYASGSFYQAISSESRTKHGFNASAIIYDELAQAPNRDLWDVLTTSTGARAQPLTIVISTAGNDRSTIMKELYDYAIQVRDGVIKDETFVPVIFEAPEDADPWDEKTWYACNPALGDFRSLDEMRTFADRAKRIPALENVFRNLYLNVWVTAESRWLSSDAWDSCAEEPDVYELEGQPCYAGLDLSSTTDLTALVLAFPADDGFDIASHFFAPEDGLDERVRRDRVPYDVWARQGFLTLTPGASVDKSWVLGRCAEILERFDLRALAYDSWRIADLQAIASREGIELPFTAFGQSFRAMAPAVDEVERLVLDGRLRHGGNPVLTWNCSNVLIEHDSSGNRKMSKRKSTGRIDGMVALAMAIAEAEKQEQDDYDPYADRGLIVV